MTDQMAEPDTRERNPKVKMIWNLLVPYIASEDPPDLSDDYYAEILTARALPRVWGLVLELEQQIEGLEETSEALRVAVARSPLWGKPGVQETYTKLKEALTEQA